MSGTFSISTSTGRYPNAGSMLHDWQTLCTEIETALGNVFAANRTNLTNVGSMLARRLRRRPNIDPTLVQCLVFAGLSFSLPSPVGPYNACISACAHFASSFPIMRSIISLSETNTPWRRAKANDSISSLEKWTATVISFYMTPQNSMWAVMVSTRLPCGG